MKGAKTGGRKAGTRNKSTVEIRELAQRYAPEVLARLFEIACGADPKAAVAACRDLLDRGYGRPVQPIDGDGQGGAIQVSWRPPEA